MVQYATYTSVMWTVETSFQSSRRDCALCLAVKILEYLNIVSGFVKKVKPIKYTFKKLGEGLIM